MRRPSIWLVPALVAALALPAAASAATNGFNQISFSPGGKGGVGTHIVSNVSFADSGCAAGAIPPSCAYPSPTMSATVHFPKGTKYPTGKQLKAFPSCSLSTVNNLGGQACPAKSQIGTGNGAGGFGTVPPIPAPITVYNGPPSGGLPTLIFWTHGVATFAFQGAIKKDSGPYGYKLVIASIPAVLAGGNVVSFTTFDTNIGGSTKYKGKTVNNITMPTKKQCHGSFKWQTDYHYTDGTSSTYKSTSPCPSH